MTLRFQTAVQVENLPDEQINSAFEVVMPSLDILPSDEKVDVSDRSLYTPIVEEITFNLPGFKKESRRIRTGWLNFVTDVNNVQDANITMFCSQNMLTQYYMDAWYNLIYNKDGEYFNNVNDYKKNIEVYFYGGASSSIINGISNLISGGDTSTAVAHFTLSGAFPISQSSYSLKYSDDPTRLTITATFAYDKLVPDLRMASSGIMTELLQTGGMSMLDSFLTGNFNMSGSSVGGAFSKARNIINNATDGISNITSKFF